MLSFSFTEKDKIKPSKAIFHIDHEKLSTIKIHYDDESNSNTASLQLDFDHSTYMALSSKQQKDNS